MLGLLVGCFALGALARRVSSVPREAPKVLNAWVLNVSLPALVLKTVHGVPLAPGVLVGAATLWALFLVSAGLAVVAVRRGWSSREVAGALALSCGLGNTAFVGVPLVEALGGRGAVAPAALLDQLGSFLVFSAGAVPFAMWMGGERPSWSIVARRLVTFPPFVALVLAFALRPVELPSGVEPVLTRLADMVTPLALASVGWQLEASGLKGHGRALVGGLVWKLGLAPAVMLAVVWLVGAPTGLEAKVAVAQAAMAPMVTAAVLATEHRLAAPVSAALAAVGAVVSFVTVPAWWAVLGRVFAE
ncbi:MAG: AEC family transporter [Myxococcaceae bacterium]|nr:AEC family transporter [Myxococcaceae bacterium]